MKFFFFSYRNIESFQETKKAKRATNNRMKAADFLDEEAEVSDDENVSSDETDEDESHPDAYVSDILASHSDLPEDPSCEFEYLHAMI